MTAEEMRLKTDLTIEKKLSYVIEQITNTTDNYFTVCKVDPSDREAAITYLKRNGFIIETVDGADSNYLIHVTWE